MRDLLRIFFFLSSTLPTSWGGRICTTKPVAGSTTEDITQAVEIGIDALKIDKTMHAHPAQAWRIGLAMEAAHSSSTDVPPPQMVGHGICCLFWWDTLTRAAGMPMRLSFGAGWRRVFFSDVGLVRSAQPIAFHALKLLLTVTRPTHETEWL